MSFIVGNSYTKKNIYSLLEVPSNQQRGAWDTGYREYNGDIFIFCNIGVPGRTGHDYKNFWDGDLFHWEARNNSNINQPIINRLINPPVGQRIFLFTRVDDRNPFTFEGEIKCQFYSGSYPVRFIWTFVTNPYNQFQEEEIISKEPQELYEGGFRVLKVNKYERNPAARRICIEEYGCWCNICTLDFESKYGVLGQGFIHVHHLNLLSSKKETYSLDPLKDLIPVCPNCHSMLHRRNPPITPNELKGLIRT